MKKLLILFIFLPFLPVFLYLRDAQTVHKAQEVVASVPRFCKENGRIPSREEFIGMYPELPWNSEWYYWPMKDGKEAHFQYPMSSSWHKEAPGNPKISEFTATTYAYTASISCSEEQEFIRIPDPISCPSGTIYRLRNKQAGAYEWCESISEGVALQKQGPYRSWFNRDLRILMEQGEFSGGRKTGLWVECNRLKKCIRKLYEPAAISNVKYSNVLENPYKELWEGEGESQGLTRFFLDLDGDGKDELFVGAKSLLGKGGGLFSIFKETDNGYVPLGDVFVHPGAFELLPIRHYGFFDLRYCAGVSAELCELIIFVFNGKEYMRSKNPTPPSSIRDLGGYGYAPVITEESGLTLTWGP